MPRLGDAFLTFAVVSASVVAPTVVVPVVVVKNARRAPR